MDRLLLDTPELSFESLGNRGRFLFCIKISSVYEKTLKGSALDHLIFNLHLDSP